MTSHRLIEAVSLVEGLNREMEKPMISEEIRHKDGTLEERIDLTFTDGKPSRI